MTLQLQKRRPCEPPRQGLKLGVPRSLGVGTLNCASRGFYCRLSGWFTIDNWKALEKVCREFLIVIWSIFCRSEAKKQQDLAEAAEAMEESASKKAATRTTKQAPYRSSSRWSRLLKVSTLQRSIQIWGFAVLFAIKYFLSTRKFTYGKKVAPSP